MTVTDSPITWTSPIAAKGTWAPVKHTDAKTSIQSTWTQKCDGPTTFSRGSKTWVATAATVLTVTDSPITWISPVAAAGTWAPVAHIAASDAVSEQTWSAPFGEYGVATQARSTAEQTNQQGWVADATEGYLKPTSSYLVSPATFTGVASKHGLTGAAVVLAAGVAFLV